jgi:hypothetical protein
MWISACPPADTQAGPFFAPPWKKYHGMGIAELGRLRQFEKENKELKKPATR